MRIRTSSIISLTSLTLFACVHHAPVDYCNAASLNKVLTRRAAQQNSGGVGALVFEARTVEAGHVPLSGALILLNSAGAMSNVQTDSIRTDATGRATFSNLVPGSYGIVVRLIGRHSIVNAPVAVRGGASDTIQVLLAPAPICENWSVAPQPR